MCDPLLTIRWGNWAIAKWNYKWYAKYELRILYNRKYCILAYLLCIYVTVSLRDLVHGPCGVPVVWYYKMEWFISVRGKGQYAALCTAILRDFYISSQTVLCICLDICRTFGSSAESSFALVTKNDKRKCIHFLGWSERCHYLRERHLVMELWLWTVTSKNKKIS